MRDAFGRDVARPAHYGVSLPRRRLATIVAIATVPVAAATYVALVHLGVNADEAFVPAVAVSGVGAALVRRLLGTGPLEIAVPVARPRLISLAVGCATAGVFAAVTIVSGGSPPHAAWLGFGSLAVARPLVGRLFYEPPPEPEDEPFQIDPGEIDRAKYEAIRTSLPRGF
jgi:hypothetical protein